MAAEATTTVAERELCVVEAIHSGEMEGLSVTVAGRQNAQKYVVDYEIGRASCRERV